MSRDSLRAEVERQLAPRFVPTDVHVSKAIEFLIEKEYVREEEGEGGRELVYVP